MDEKKQPGISVKRINLLSCEAGSVIPDADLAYQTALTSLVRRLSEDKLTLSVQAAFDMMHDIPKPPCTLKCTFLAEYTRKQDSNMTWEEFSDAQTVMHLIPFVREFVSSITLRLPIGELLIPPINAMALIDDLKSRQSPSS